MTDQKHTKEPTIDERIDDLILQATTERSHYYTKSILEAAKTTIFDLRRQRDELREAIEFAVNDLKDCDWSCHVCGTEQGMDETDLFDILTKALTKTKESV